MDKSHWNIYLHHFAEVVFFHTRAQTHITPWLFMGKSQFRIEMKIAGRNDINDGKVLQQGSDKKL